MSIFATTVSRRRTSRNGSHAAARMRQLGIAEAHVFLLVNERNLARRSVSLLGHDDVDVVDARMLAFLLILAMQHQDGVGVLLDCARFAQVAQARFFLLAVFEAAIA